MSTVGIGCAAVAPGTTNQCSRICAPSKEVSTQSLATPLTRDTAGVVLGPGGTQRAGVTPVGVGLVDVGARDGADFDADEEQAAATTSSATPTDRMPCLTPVLP